MGQFDYLYQKTGTYIKGSRGPYYRRLMLLSFLTEMEHVCDDPLDTKQIQETRKALQAPSTEPDKRAIATEEAEVVDLLDSYTDPMKEWGWSKANGNLELWNYYTENNEQTTSPNPTYNWD